MIYVEKKDRYMTTFFFDINHLSYPARLLNFASKLEINYHHYILNRKLMETIKYPAGEITILWQPEICIHAGICVSTLPKVYDPKARPWIRTENATTQELIGQVAKCPSGALSIVKNEENKEVIK